MPSSRSASASRAPSEDPIAGFNEPPNVREEYIGNQVEDRVPSRQPSIKDASLKEAPILSINDIKKKATASINNLAKEANKYMNESKSKDKAIAKHETTIEKLKDTIEYLKSSNPTGNAKPKKTKDNTIPAKPTQTRKKKPTYQEAAQEEI